MPLLPHALLLRPPSRHEGNARPGSPGEPLAELKHGAQGGQMRPCRSLCQDAAAFQQCRSSGSAGPCTLISHSDSGRDGHSAPTAVGMGQPMTSIVVSPGS